MSANNQAGQQADLELIVTRIARRAADALAQQTADLGVQLALAQETVAGQAAAIDDKDRQLGEKDAELARAHQTADLLQARITELEAPAPVVDDGEDEQDAPDDPEE
jgi:hypothetical protein